MIKFMYVMCFYDEIIAMLVLVAYNCFIKKYYLFTFTFVTIVYSIVCDIVCLMYKLSIV